LKDLQNILPVGKLPPELLAQILSAAPLQDDRLLVGPGVGLDCAVVDIGSTLLAFKSDPITFATDEIGWYAVQVNANDIATSGAVPTWFLMTLLLPEGGSTAELVEQISQQVYQACQQMRVSVIGGHSEVTAAVKQPVIVGTMIGEVAHQDLVTPQGAQPGDRLLLTKGVPIEAVSVLAREFPNKLKSEFRLDEIEAAQNYLYQPGISVLKDAQVATKAGEVTAMHDPTEGGLAAALWELASAGGHDLVVNTQKIFIPPLAGRICAVFEIDPLASIASGALLLTTPADQVAQICQTLELDGIPCSEIGEVERGKSQVWIEKDGKRDLLQYPKRDEIARVFESG
jgi:hydrogenase maturation factor